MCKLKNSDKSYTYHDAQNPKHGHQKHMKVWKRKTLNHYWKKWHVEQPLCWKSLEIPFKLYIGQHIEKLLLTQQQNYL